MGLPILAPIDDRQLHHRSTIEEADGFPVPAPAPRAARLKRWAGGLGILACSYFLMTEHAIALLPFLLVAGWLWMSGTAATVQARGGVLDW